MEQTSVTAGPRRTRQGQIDQTREWATQALLELMETKPWHTITFIDLAKRSGLARQTLHRHFETKDDILLWYMDHIFEDFSSHMDKSINPRTKEGIQNNTRLALETCYHNRRFLQSLHRHGLSHLFLDKIQTFAYAIATDQTLKNHGPDINFRIIYFAGGFHHLVMTWLSQDSPWPVDQFHNLVSPMISL